MRLFFFLNFIILLSFNKFEFILTDDVTQIVSTENNATNVQLNDTVIETIVTSINETLNVTTLNEVKNESNVTQQQPQQVQIESTNTEEHKMQSFEEWKHMRLKEQQSTETTITTTSTVSSTMTSSTIVSNNIQHQQVTLTSQQRVIHKKNFASVECGAKILASNVESSGASHILTESKDEYMLNSCSNKIWFIIELCEPIQISDFEIANFELFSNVPKQFRVYASERYPNKNWTKALIGVFDAAPIRNVQLFQIDYNKKQAQTSESSEIKDEQQQQNIYVKYVKFEMLSHYGNEHYCPISLVRIYGVTLVDDDVDGGNDDVTQGSNSVGSSTTDNVNDNLNVVQNVTNTVVNDQQSEQQKDAASKEGIIDFAYKAINNIIVGNSDQKPEESQLSSSTQSQPQETIATSTQPQTSQSTSESSSASSVPSSSINTKTDNIVITSTTANNEPVITTQSSATITSSTPTQTFESTQKPLNVEPEKEKKRKFFYRFINNLISFFIHDSHKSNNLINEQVTTTTVIPLTTTTTPVMPIHDQQQNNDNMDNRISGMIYKTLLCSYSSINQICCQCLINNTQNFHSYCTYYFILLNTCKNVFTQFAHKYEKSIKQFIDLNLINNTIPSNSNNYTTNYTQVNINNISYLILNDLIFTFNETSKANLAAPTSATTTTATATSATTTTTKPVTTEQQQQTTQPPKTIIQPIVTSTNTKDVLIMRLNNRIRALELNMSLSGQYLEQLSQHYRKQIDEMQKIFNKTTSSLHNTSIIIDEYNLKQQNQIKSIEKRLDSLQLPVNLLLNSFNTNYTITQKQRASSNNHHHHHQQQHHQHIKLKPLINNYFVNNEVLCLLFLILCLNLAIFILLIIYIRLRLRTYVLIKKMEINKNKIDEAFIKNLLNQHINELNLSHLKEYEEIGKDNLISKCGSGSGVKLSSACTAAAAVVAASAVAVVSANSSSSSQMNANT